MSVEVVGDIKHEGLYGNHGYDEDFYGMLIKKISGRHQQGAVEPTTSTTTSIYGLLEWTSSGKRQISANMELTVTQPVRTFTRTRARVDRRSDTCSTSRPTERISLRTSSFAVHRS
jgi:hypothetical protein